MLWASDYVFMLTDSGHRSGMLDANRHFCATWVANRTAAVVSRWAWGVLA